MGTLYLLHLVPRFHHAGHYLGFTRYADATKRVDAHKAGRGAHLTAAAVAAGCLVVIVARGAGDRRRERQIKRNSHLWRWCPVCCKKLHLRPWKLSAPKSRPVAESRRRLQSA